jgi:hypothetical protein
MDGSVHESLPGVKVGNQAATHGVGEGCPWQGKRRLPDGAVEVCQRRRRMHSRAEAPPACCCGTVVANDGGFHETGSFFACQPVSPQPE